MKKLLMLCGIFAAIVYVGTVILGGLLRPGYSHVSMAISELVAEGAPNRALLSSLFLLYNALLTIFGIGLFLKTNGPSRGRLSGIIGSLALVLVGVAGILMELVFPQELGGTARTFAGMIHFVMAGIASIGTMVAILSLSRWFREFPDLKGYVTYSMISVSVIFISGALSAVVLANHSPFFGLIERITILTFTLWIFVVGRKMARLEGESHEEKHFRMMGSTSKGI